MAGATVLLTGATGFLGKVVLEDLLRRREALGLARIFVLIRAAHDVAAKRRLDFEVVGSECLAAHGPDALELVELVRGDLCQEGCGLDAEGRAALTAQITHIVHCAASIDFDLPIAEAARINIDGALNVLALARECSGLMGMASVSTAYVTPHPSGGEPVEEVLAPLPQPAARLHEAIRDGSVEERALLRETGHPNTYTLTKCIAEHLLLERRGAVPLALVRPSIISASRSFPFPGWIDSHAAFAGFVSMLGTGALHVVAARPEARVDVVPVDEVARRSVDAAFARPPVAPAPARIVHAVAGRQGCCTVAMCAESIEHYFGDRPIGRGPRIRYIGPDGPFLRAREWLWQDLPTRAADLWHGLRRRPTQRRTIARLAERRRHLNRVFPYFTHRTFEFRSSEPLDASFEPRDYLATVCAGVYRHLLRQDETELVFAGGQQRAGQSDLRWALSQPRGGMGIRFAGFVLAKIFRRISPRFSVDLASFQEALGRLPGGTSLVLAPSHRSYVDFLVIPYLCFALPRLGLSLPHIAADEQFARIPLLSRLASACNAFFLRRGQGGEDKTLTRQVHALIRDGASILFFIEGGRSRSRVMLQPRRGLLRSLQATGEQVAILPIAISYDRIPEERAFAVELCGGPRQRIELGALVRWLRSAWRGEVDIGPVHLRCAAPLPLDLSTDVHELARATTAALQTHMVATTHQLRCFVARSPRGDVDAAWLGEAIRARGGRVIQSRMRGERDVPPVVEMGMREQWQHWFLAELSDAVDEPALRHWLDRRIGMSPVVVPESDDPRLAHLLDALAEPARRAYRAARAWVAMRTETGAVPTPVEIVRERPDLYLPHLEAAFDRLCEEEILVAAGDGTRCFGPRVRDAASSA